MTGLLAFLAALAVLMAPVATAAAAPADEPSTTTPIKHVVMLMQDNHSFDNYFGTYPGADGIPSGVCQRLSLTRPSTKGCIKPYHLGVTPADDLSQTAGIQDHQYNKGKMDGFVAAYRRLGRDGSSSMGYYDGGDLPYYWNVADQYVLFDRFFASTSVGSRESYLYWLAGKAPGGKKPLTSNAGYDSLPTIFDRLNDKKISAKFYVENLDKRVTSSGGLHLARSSQLIKVPLLSMKRFQDQGPLAGRVVDLSEYYSDVRNGTLPAVSYIVASGASENPPARVQVGQRLVQQLTGELIRSHYWDSSAFMWSYDGWGGWYDHVPPPKIDDRGYGFRVPALLVSPYARRGVVDHTVLDYTAMLQFVETNWRLKPLAARDASSPGLASAFDFNSQPREAALIPTFRSSEAPPVTSTAGIASVVYVAYGGAAAVAGLLALAVLVRRPGRNLLPVAVVGLAKRPERSHPRRLAESPTDDSWVNWIKARNAERPSGPPARRMAQTFPDDGGEWARWYESTHPTTGSSMAEARRHPQSVNQRKGSSPDVHSEHDLEATNSMNGSTPI